MRPGEERLLRQLAREVVLADLGPGPWECECDEKCGTVLVQFGSFRGEAHIHHVDENVANYARENLRLLTTSCHRRHHRLGKIDGAGTCEKHRLVMLGNTLGVANKNRVLSPAHRRKLSIAAAGRKSNLPRRACNCGLETTPGPMARHTKSSGHQLSG